MALSDVQNLRNANIDEDRMPPIAHDDCKMTLFSEINYRGVAKIITWTMSSIEFRERSLVTEGPCCWKIYRGINNFQVIEGGSRIRSNGMWRRRPGQIISVRRIDPNNSTCLKESQ